MLLYRMPSAKSSKSSTTILHYPPTNRAFALRMMNSAQHSEGKMSTLDRALKPFKETFKKNNKGKKTTGRGTSSPTASSLCTNESKDEDASDASLEFICEDQHTAFSCTNQLKKTMHESNGNGRLQRSHSENSHHSVTSVESEQKSWLYGRYRAMTDIAEEEEFSNNTKEDYPGFKELKSCEGYANVINDIDLATADSLNKNKSVREIYGRKNSEKGDATDFFHNENDYFVAPNGEIVRLRKKIQKDRSERNRNESSALCTEKFSKRLSLLCHMLAEKYPEDFHILELLVELQVSNENREEEMNKSIALLKQKVESMEDRLVLVEQQSFSGFRQMLVPLAEAAEAFSKGINDSLINVNQSNHATSDKETATDCICKTESKSEIDLSLNGFLNEKKDTMDIAFHHDIKPGICNERHENQVAKVENSGSKSSCSASCDSQAVDYTLTVMTDKSNKTTDEDCSLVCDGTRGVQETEQISCQAVLKSLNEGESWNDQGIPAINNESGSSDKVIMVTKELKNIAQNSCNNESTDVNHNGRNNNETDLRKEDESDVGMLLANETSV